MQERCGISVKFPNVYYKGVKQVFNFNAQHNRLSLEYRYTDLFEFYRKTITKIQNEKNMKNPTSFCFIFQFYHSPSQFFLAFLR